MRSGRVERLRAMTPNFIRQFERSISTRFPGTILWSTWHEKGAHLSSLVRATLAIHRIEVEQSQRGQGIGSQIFHSLFLLADQEQFDITLTPSDQFGGKIPKLRRWYRRLGFTTNESSWAELRYTPKIVLDNNGQV